MMEILKHPDPRLRQVCEALDEIEIKSGLYASVLKGADFRTTESLVREMLETCRAAKGIGMAAPQVGIMRRIIVACPKGWELAIVNPVITKGPHTTGMHEGCLSYPGRRVYVTRARTVRVSGFDVHGEPITVKATGLLAAVLQHEVDHLDGVCKVGPKEARYDQH